MSPTQRMQAELQCSRRGFLVSACASGALLAMGTSCGGAPAKRETARGQEQLAASRKLGIALLGLGQYSTEQLAPALQKTKHCALRGIVTGTPSKVADWQKKYDLSDRNVYDYASLPRIANNSDIDIVYIVVPTSLHAKFAIMAAEAGKHVFCEKPMAMNVGECQAIIDACRKNGVSLSIGYRMHHEPNTQTVMRWAHEKPYGAIKSLSAVAGDRSDGEPTWRMKKEMGGGALYDMGVYSINALRYASGEEPTRVLRARQWADRPELFTEVDESTEFELELPSGAAAYGMASRSNQENSLRVEAEHGSYHLEPMQQYTGVKGEASDGKKLDAHVDNQQAKQMDEESLAILERRPTRNSGEEGLRDIRIVEAIMESARLGKAVAL